MISESAPHPFDSNPMSCYAFADLLRKWLSMKWLRYVDDPTWWLAVFAIMVVSLGRGQDPTPVQPGRSVAEAGIISSHERVTVAVVDAISSQPIAIATVARIRPDQSLPVAEGQTDANGRIALNCDGRVLTSYLVSAPGRRSQTFSLWGCTPPSHRIALQPPNGSLSGRLEDATGKPIAGAPVRLVFTDYLEGIAAAHEVTFPIEVRTDHDGRFELPAAPDSELEHILFQEGDRWLQVTPASGDSESLRRGTYVGHPGDLAVAEKPVIASVSIPTLTIHLRVIDAKTHDPIHRVRVLAGGASAPDQPLHTLAHSGLDLRGDDVTWAFYNDEAWAFFLRVEAEGYATAPTRVVKASEKEVTLELKLNAAMPMSAAVLAPNGQPASGAKAYLATPTIDLQAPTGDTDAESPAPIAIAGEDGILHFSLPDEPSSLAIVHPGGWAEFTPVANDLTGQPLPAVKLTPWASINLAFGPDDHPLPRVLVETQSVESNQTRTKEGRPWEIGHLSWTSFRRSNETGKVMLPFCRPVNDSGVFVSAQAPRTDDERTRDGWESLNFDQPIKPGQQVNLRLMTGRTKVQTVLAQPLGYEWDYLSIAYRGSTAGLPADFNHLPHKEQVEALKQRSPLQRDTDAGDTGLHHFSLRSVLGKDGTIAVTGLRAGVYTLTGHSSPGPNIHGQSPVSQPATQPPRINWLFAIPGSEPPVVDLGTILPDERETPALPIGQIVPSLDSITFDGKPFHLEDLRGHWVLLDFWGTWCGPCLGEEPTLKDACEGWAIDGRLTMVSASVEDTPEEVRKHVTDNHLSWTQLVLGPRNKSDILKAFGVEVYPTIMLISPEGKLVKTGLRSVLVREALISLLGPPSPPRAAGKDNSVR